MSTIRISRWFGVTFLAAVSLHGSQSFAADDLLRIYDCANAVRFEQPLSDETAIELNVSQIKDGVLVTLQNNKDKSNDQSAVVHEGKVIFNDIGMGDWTFCTGGTLEKISAVNRAEGDVAMEVASITGLVGVAAGGAVLLDSSGSSGDGAALSSGSAITESAGTTTQPRTTSSRPRPREVDTTECFIKEEVEPLSPIS